MDTEMDIQPDCYDVIVVGTGLAESILAAASAAAGLTVLHLDSADVYGSAWASLSPVLIENHVGGGSKEEEEVVQEEQGEFRFMSTAGSGAYSGFKVGVLRQEGNGEEMARLSAYSLDLAGPKLAFSAGAVVDLLLRSGVTSYLEFKAVESSYLWTADGLAAVPASQAEVFSDLSLSLVEKRLLMRFLKLVTDQATGTGALAEEELERPFVEFLRRQQLPPSIRAMILYVIAFAESEQEGDAGLQWTVREGLQRLALYRASVGRFTNAPGAFIYPLYGQGELPQAFCRGAAVKGALYVLRRPVDAVVLDRSSGGYRGVRTAAGQLLWSEKLVIGRTQISQQAQDELVASYSESSGDGIASGNGHGLSYKVARLVCVTDASFKPGQANVLVVFPPGSVFENFSSVIYALQLGGNTSVCPQGQYVLQLSALCRDDAGVAEDLLRTAAKVLFLSDARGEGDVINEVRVLWSAFFLSDVVRGFVVGGQVAVCPMPDQAIDYGSVVTATEKIFHEFFPTKEFFPAVPAVDENQDTEEEDYVFGMENGAVDDGED